jgi:hypothetical protein
MFGSMGGRRKFSGQIISPPALARDLLNHRSKNVYAPDTIAPLSPGRLPAFDLPEWFKERQRP